MNPYLPAGEIAYRIFTLVLLCVAVGVNVACSFKLAPGMRLVYRVGAFVAGLMATAWAVLIFLPVQYEDWIQVIKWISAIAIATFYIGPGVTNLWGQRALAEIIRRRYGGDEE